MLGDCLYQRLYADEPYLTPATTLALVARIQAFGAKLAIEGHDENLLDTEAFARRLHELRSAAERVHRAGRRGARDGGRRGRPRDARVPAGGRGPRAVARRAATALSASHSGRPAWVG